GEYQTNDDDLNEERREQEARMRRQVVLLALLGPLLMFSTARGQESRENATQRICNHGGFDLWDFLRILPVRFTEFNGDTAKWKYQDEYNVKLGSFVLCEKAQYLSAEEKTVDVRYLMQRKESIWLCYY